MKLLRLCLTISVVLGGASGVYGEMLEDLTLLSPKALSMANAVVADPPAIDSIHFNPAGLARLTESKMELKLATFWLKTRYSSGDQQVDPATKSLYEQLAEKPYPDDPLENLDGETGDPLLLIPGGSTERNPVPIVPLGGGAIVNPDTGVVFATSVYAPMMVGYNRADNDFGRYQGSETAISRLTYFSPTVAFQFSDTLLLGLGINFNYQGIALQMETRAPQAVSAVLGAFAETVTGEQLGPGPYDDLAQMKITVEDYLSVGFNLGMLWDVQPWLTLGLSYRSESTARMTGDFAMTYSEKMLSLTNTLKVALPAIEGNRIEKGKASMEFTIPKHLAVGSSMKITENLKLNIDVQKSFYKAWDSFTFDFDQEVDYLVFATIFDPDATPRSLSLPRHYKNAVSWSVGVEYDWSERLHLRAGFQKRNGVIPANSLDLIIPVSDSDFYGIGFAFDQGQGANIEVGLGYLVTEYDVDYGQSNNLNSEDPLDLVYNPYTFLPVEVSTKAVLLSLSYVKPI